MPRAWEKWRVGFRVDGGKGVGGSNRDDLKRITTEGSRPLQKLPDLAVMCVQKYYHEHDCSKSSDLYIGYQNRDLYNESGTCVSRSLFGATAFPYRDTQNNTPGLAPHLSGNLQFQYLFAIDCDGARGLDTEQVQVDMGNASLWRPGEKAFAGFGPERVLGWNAHRQDGPTQLQLADGNRLELQVRRFPMGMGEEAGTGTGDLPRSRTRDLEAGGAIQHRVDL